jgi:branched-chain amino acid transport system permease protein
VALWELAVQQVINGLLNGGIYAVASLGLMITWGVLKLVNVAHGEFIMLGAYAFYWPLVLLKMDSPGLLISLSMLPPLLVGVILAASTYLLFIRRVMAMDPLTSLLSLFGLSLILINIATMLWDVDVRGVPLYLGSLQIGGFVLIVTRLLGFLAALAAVGLLFLLLYRTYPGRAMRAIMQNRRAAALVGINMERYYFYAFMLGTLLATAAGSLASIAIAHVDPFMGGAFTVKAFAVVLLGGLSNPAYVFIWALVFGVIEAVFASLVNPMFSAALPLILMIAAVAWWGARLYGR